MMKKVFILLLLILVALPSIAQSIKPRVGVLDFTANNISLSEAITIGEMFTSELVLSGKYDVVDRKNIESLMAEMEFQMSGCTDSSCAVEVGQILALDFMMYGSINKLGESFVINVYMINVETAQIEGTSRERFSTIEQSYDVMSAVIGKLIEGDSYKGSTPVLPEQEIEEALVADKQSRPANKFIDVGAGYVSGEWESGFEIETSYRHMLGSTFGLGGGILLGYGSGDDNYMRPGLKFGLNFLVYYQINRLMGVAVGFKGLPGYINSFGGPTVGLYFGRWYARLGLQIIEAEGVSIDLGYCFTL